MAAERNVRLLPLGAHTIKVAEEITAVPVEFVRILRRALRRGAETGVGASASSHERRAKDQASRECRSQTLSKKAPTPHPNGHHP
jgi:hypothetical protein